MKSKTGAISGSTKWTLVQTKNFYKKKKVLKRVPLNREWFWVVGFNDEGVFDASNGPCVLEQFKKQTDSRKIAALRESGK